MRPLARLSREDASTHCDTEHKKSLFIKHAQSFLLNGEADVAAVSDYTFEGPKANKYLTPEERAKLQVLDRTFGVPTHLIAVSTSLPEALRLKIKNALLDISKDNNDLLSDVYGASKFVEVKHEFSFKFF